jgi:hypothetical protein
MEACTGNKLASLLDDALVDMLEKDRNGTSFRLLMMKTALRKIICGTCMGGEQMQRLWTRQSIRYVSLTCFVSFLEASVTIVAALTSLHAFKIDGRPTRSKSKPRSSCPLFKPRCPCSSAYPSRKTNVVTTYERDLIVAQS